MQNFIPEMLVRLSPFVYLSATWLVRNASRLEAAFGNLKMVSDSEVLVWQVTFSLGARSDEYFYEAIESDNVFLRGGFFVGGEEGDGAVDFSITDPDGTSAGPLVA